jgi:hypothetical protein
MLQTANIGKKQRMLITLLILCCALFVGCGAGDRGVKDAPAPVKPVIGVWEKEGAIPAIREGTTKLDVRYDADNQEFRVLCHVYGITEGWIGGDCDVHSSGERYIEFTCRDLRSPIKVKLLKGKQKLTVEKDNPSTAVLVDEDGGTLIFKKK